MACNLCEQRGKNWSGSDPNCAFPNGVFDPDNWNCATANAIRDICVLEPHEFGHELVDYQFCDDQNYATINTSDISEISGISEIYPLMGGSHDWWLALWVTWYKRRGRTEGMYLLGEGRSEPRRPTEDECLAIINHFFAKEAQ